MRQCNVLYNPSSGAIDFSVMFFADNLLFRDFKVIHYYPLFLEYIIALKNSKKGLSKVHQKP